MKVSKTKQDFWLGVAAIVLGVGYALCIPWQVSDFSEGYNISGRTFPYIISGIMVLIGLGLTVTAWKKLKTAYQHEFCVPFSRETRIRICAYIALIAAYILGICYVGFAVSTVLACYTAMWLSGARNKKIILLISLVTTASIYVLFTIVMEVYFPETPLW